MQVVELRVRGEQIVEHIGRVGEVGAPGVDEDGQLVEGGAVEEIASRMKVDGASRRAADLILQITGDSTDRRIRRKIEADLRWESCLVESGPGRGRIDGGRRPVEMTGNAGGNQVGRGRGPRRAK